MPPAPPLHQITARLVSFDKKRIPSQKALQWPWPAESGASLASELMAAAGFHHCPTKALPLRTRCFLCALEVQDWADGEDPVATHVEMSPSCGWAVVKSSEWAEGVRPQSEWAGCWGEDGSGWPRSERWGRVREETFSVGWPHEGRAGFPTKEEVAAAGWTFQADHEEEEGVGVDRCVCPFCTRSVEGWEEGDDPV